MARKKKYQYEENKDDDDFFVSRSQKKRDSSLLQTIGEEIVLLPQPKLDKLPLSEDLKLAIAEHKRLSNKEAKRRQLQYIGRLMRESQEQSFQINATQLEQDAIREKNTQGEQNTQKMKTHQNTQSLDLVTAYLEMKKGW